jgi:hypothetical protein
MKVDRTKWVSIDVVYFHAYIETKVRFSKITETVTAFAMAGGANAGSMTDGT